MNILFFLTLCAVNCVALIVVSMYMLYSLRKSEQRTQATVETMIGHERSKLTAVLTELSNVTTVLYNDVHAREHDLRTLVSEADERINELTCAVRRAHAHTENAPVAHEVVAPQQEMSDAAVIEQSPVRSIPVEQKVYDLVDRGFSIIDIAKIVGRQRGEVELILHLRELNDRKGKHA